MKISGKAAALLLAQAMEGSTKSAEKVLGKEKTEQAMTELLEKGIFGLQNISVILD